MNRTIQKTYLVLAGAILSLVGFYIGFMPTDYLIQFVSKEVISNDILSEMRGMGGTLFIFGVFIFSGSYFKQIKGFALMTSGLIYTSFSMFRAIGFILDGMPSQNILIAFSIEVVFAIIAILLLTQNKQVLTNGQDSQYLVR